MKFYLSLTLLIFIILSCNQIETGVSLKKNDVARISKLGLLEDNEIILKFYSQHKVENAGNFFTNKRIAKYWFDERDGIKNEISFAFYKDIKSIDTIYNPGITYCPYLMVTKNDNSKFKVCADGTGAEIHEFFEEALAEWRKNIH